MGDDRERIVPGNSGLIEIRDVMPWLGYGDKVHGRDFQRAFAEAEARGRRWAVEALRDDRRWQAWADLGYPTMDRRFRHRAADYLESLITEGTEP